MLRRLLERPKESSASPAERPTENSASPSERPTENSASPPERPTESGASPPERPTENSASPPERPTENSASPPERPAESSASPPERTACPSPEVVAVIKNKSSASLPEGTVCPPPEVLAVIKNNVRCEKCGLTFRNEPRYRLHNLKVHQRQKLAKVPKEKKLRYHCPDNWCIYGVNSQRYFTSMKYLKQHYLNVHAEKNYPCDRCDRSFSTEARKNRHMRDCGIEFTCSCSKIYGTYEALLTHTRRSPRASCVVPEKFKPLKRIKSKTVDPPPPPPPPPVTLPKKIRSKPIFILPKQIEGPKKGTCDVAIQTDEFKRSKKTPSPSKLNNNNLHNAKRPISKETQTNSVSKQKTSGTSIETQTPQASEDSSKSPHKRGEKCRALSNQSEQTLPKEDLNLGDNFASANLFPASPLPLRHDVALQDYWEKNTSGTQTIPEKDMFEFAFNDSVTQTEFDTFYTHNPLIQCVPTNTVALMTLPYVEGYSFASTDGMCQADPMLIVDRFSSIETQTEQAYSPLYFYPDFSRSIALSTNIETQTTDNLDNMEQLLYSNTYTQTCNEMLSSDLGLSNIQTQTAWSHDDTTVSTETQTKSLICETDCNIPTGGCRSWLNTQISHTETQTDLLNMFEEL